MTKGTMYPEIRPVVGVNRDPGTAAREEMPTPGRFLKPAAFGFYVVIALEILFMISPFALYFYSVYGPVLRFLQRSPETAWLTQFFLPHISETRSAFLNGLHWLSGPLVIAGTVLFLAGAIPIYWSKLRHRDAVTGGLYRFIRHPQYGGLSILGLGTLLLWPRFLVLISYVVMVFLYVGLARWEEECCLARFGDSYRNYQTRAGMFLPKFLSSKVPRIFPVVGSGGVLVRLGLFGFSMVAMLWLSFQLRDYSLGKICVAYSEDTVVLSPAVLSPEELLSACRTSVTDRRVLVKLEAAEPGNLMVYVVPAAWYLADLPIEEIPRNAPGHGHYQPANFDRRYYKVLFARARTHPGQVPAEQILKAAYGLDPIVLARVDISAGTVGGVETPPEQVYWGDIPTPMF